MIRTAFVPLGLLLLAACSMPPSDSSVTAQQEVTDPASLRSVQSFSTIRDRSERSVALFTEAGRVLQHPRCLNCHPRTRMPTQGDDLHAHVPMMQAQEAGHGPPALQCNTCHQAANVTTHAQSIRSIPGDSHWALAPASMAWQGATLRQICEQLKDTSRNGGRTLEAIHKHVAEDALVGWAWHPGEGRTPAPGTQQAFGALVEAWIGTGAHCPSP